MDAMLELEGSRKRAKIRSAWISFAGRIVAQLIGAIATVTLGVVVLGGRAAPAAPAAAAEPTVLVATPVRTHGETVIVMMPLGKDGRVDQALAANIAETFENSKQPEEARRTVARRPSPAPLAGAPQAEAPGDVHRE